jgi:hypothetical protein
MKKHLGRRTALFSLAFLAVFASQSSAIELPSIQAERESAITWGMRDIAILQAGEGDMQSAKQTLSQIRQMPFGLSAADLKSPGWARRDAFGSLYFFACDRPADHMPGKAPEGLPANYLDADPAHGPVVDFVDDSDGHGVRVTSRRYADGYAVIETPTTVENR